MTPSQRKLDLVSSNPFIIAKSTLQYVMMKLRDYMDRDDDLLSKEAREILSDPDDRRAFFEAVDRLRKKSDNGESPEENRETVKLKDRDIVISF